MNLRAQTIATWLFSATITAAAPNVTQSGLGRGPDGGDTATIFTLRNGNGITARILTPGAIIAELSVPDRDGKLANIVLAPEDPAQLLEDFKSPAAVIGRCANRTAGARFTIDGTEYQLAANNGPNNLHGGPRHFGRHDWTGRIVQGDEAAVEYLSPLPFFPSATLRSTAEALRLRHD